MKSLRTLPLLVVVSIMALFASGCPMPSTDEECDVVCDEGEVCVEGDCVPEGDSTCNRDEDCDDGDPCTQDSCDLDAGAICSHDPFFSCATLSDCPAGCFTSCTGGFCSN